MNSFDTAKADIATLAEPDNPMRDDDKAYGGRAIKRIARGSVVALLVYGVGIGLTYLSQLIVARIVGVDTYGVYAYVFAWMGVLAYVAALGFDVALLRFIPAYEAKGAWPQVAGVIQYSQRAALAVGVLIIAAGIPILNHSSISADIRSAFLAGFALVPIMALVRIRCSIIRAFGGVAAALASDRIARDGLLIITLVVVALLMPSGTIDAPFIMLVTVLSAAVGLAMTTFALRYQRPAALDNVTPAFDSIAWRRAVLPLVIAGATEALMNRTGTIVLGWMDATTDAGIYSLVFNVSLVVGVPRIAVNTLFAPAISGLHARNDKQMMQELVTKAASWTLLSGLVVAGILFAIAEPLLAWFGHGYEVGTLALRILLVSQVIAAGAGSQLYVMTMTGHEGSAAKLLMAIAIGNGVVTMLLVGPFGLAGAAVATGVTLVIWNAAMAYFLWKRLQLWPGMLGFLRK